MWFIIAQLQWTNLVTKEIDLIWYASKTQDQWPHLSETNSFISSLLPLKRRIVPVSAIHGISSAQLQSRGLMRRLVFWLVFIPRASYSFFVECPACIKMTQKSGQDSVWIIIRQEWYIPSVCFWVFRPSATVSRIDLMESRLRHCRGGPIPLLPDPPGWLMPPGW